MPSFATYANLREWGETPAAKAMLKVASHRPGKTTFLSHSTDEDDLVPGAVHILENHGGKVYVDHRDPTLPETDCLAIAEHLRTVIAGCRKFVMLATPRSKDSKWIPWELGLGDGLRNNTNVALFPLAESAADQQWAEREYLGLYQRIVWGRLEGSDDPLWLVWNYRTNTAESLTKWLART